MNKIEIKDLYLVFGDEKLNAFKMLSEGAKKQEIQEATGCIVAVNKASLTIREGELFVIMGCSGSGKSTLLRCINRLVHSSSGEIFVNGTEIARASEQDLREIRRKVLAMVFQNFGLLPHRTVLHNIAFGLELQGMEKNKRERLAQEMLLQVGLEGYGDYKVSELSGGMQQRVGLARALTNDPEVLLMDEAFSALDPLIRIQMQDELLALQAKMKKTIVFITHDLNEAIKLGNRIAIMNDGEVIQVGTPEEILTEPANKYVQDFVESVNRAEILVASSIMITNPVIVRLDGRIKPEVIIRKMRERNMGVLPVVDNEGILKGEVRQSDLQRLERDGINSIGSAIRNEVHSVLSDTVLGDILPLLTRTNSPIWVVDENRKFLGTIPLSLLISEATGKERQEINELIQNSIEL